MLFIFPFMMSHMGELRFSTRTQIAFSVIALRQLLQDIVLKKPEVCFRYRLIGEMWTPNFKKVLHVSEKGVLLRDEVTNNLTAINDLSNLIQFEIDSPFQNIRPYCHYDVRLHPE
jgi:hypothetical protein